MTYEYFEHIADIGIKAKGNTIEEAFSETAKAMFNSMVDITKIKNEKEIEFNTDAENNEELLVEFLNKLLTYSDIEDLMFSDFKIKIKDNKLNCVAKGCDTKKVKQYLKIQVKAATYSNLSVKQEKDKFICKLIVDV